MDEDWSSPWADADNEAPSSSNSDLRNPESTKAVNDDTSTNLDKSESSVQLSVQLTDFRALPSPLGEQKTQKTAVWGSFGGESAWADFSKPAVGSGVMSLDNDLPDWSVNDDDTTEVFANSTDSIKKVNRSDSLGSLGDGWGNLDDGGLAPPGYSQWSTLSTGSNWGDDRSEIGVEEDAKLPDFESQLPSEPDGNRPKTETSRPTTPSGLDVELDNLPGEVQEGNFDDGTDTAEIHNVAPEAPLQSEVPEIPKIPDIQKSDTPIVSYMGLNIESERIEGSNQPQEEVKKEKGEGGGKKGEEKEGEEREIGEEADKTTSDAKEFKQVEQDKGEKVEGGGGEEEDFGDFADEAEFENQTTEETKCPPASEPGDVPPISLDIPHLSIETNLILKLYPIPVSYPDPPPLEPEIISSTGARKAWYRLTKAENMRKSNTVGDDDYVVVNWRNSKIKDEVNAIVSKWAPEERVLRKNGKRLSKNPGGMFGWGDQGRPQSPSASSVQFSTGSARSSGTFSSGITYLPKLESPKEAPKTTVVTSKPPNASFGWGEASKPTPEDEKPSTPSVASDSPKRISAPFAQLPPTPPQKPPAPTVPSSVTDPSVKKIEETQPPMERPIVGWGAFENITNSTSKALAPNDEWSLFDSLVTDGAVAPAGEEPDVKASEINSLDTIKISNSSLSTSEQNYALSIVTGEKSTNGLAKKPIKSVSKFDDISLFTSPAGTRHVNLSGVHAQNPLKQVEPSIDVEDDDWGELMDTPNAPTGGNVSSVDDEEEDEWGELVETPVSSGFGNFNFDLPVMASSRPTSSNVVLKPMPMASLASMNGLKRSNTLPLKPKAQHQPQHAPAIYPAPVMQTTINPNRISMPVFSTPAPSISQRNNGPWDLSIFETPSSASDAKSKSMPSADIWDLM